MIRILPNTITILYFLLSRYFGWTLTLEITHGVFKLDYFKELVQKQLLFPYRSGYHTDEIYAKVDDMTYYPVNSMMVNLPSNSTGSTTMSSSHQAQHSTLGPHLSGLPSGIPPPPGAPAGSTKTLSHHHMNLLNPRPSDFHANFGTVHRSQKIYL